MSNNKHIFDEHFRQRLTDHESPVPDDLFSRLQARRGAALPDDAPLRERLAAHASPVSDTIFDVVLAERERRKRRRIVLWRAFAGIAVLWLLGTLLFDFYQKSNVAKTTYAAQNSTSDIKNTEESKIDFNTKKEASNTPSNSELINKNKELNSDNNAELINKNKELNTSLNSNNNPLINNNLTTNNNKLRQQIIIAEKRNFNKKSIATSKEKNTKYTSNNTISSIFRENTEGSNANLINKNLELNTRKTSVNTPNTEGSNANLINKNAALNTHKTSVNNLVKAVNFLELLTIKTLELPSEKRKNPCTDPENGCPTFNGRRRGMRRTTFYVDAFGAPEYVMRSFKTNLLESEKLLAARDSIEKTQYAVSAGARASLVFGNGLALRAGIVFNQINERAQFDSMGVGSIKTTYDVHIVNGKPDTVSITTVITDGIFRKTRHNHYRSMDIPLQIGYEIPLPNGWTFGFNGGANINIAAWQKADIVGADLRKQSVSSGINGVNSVFRTQLGISVFGSVAAYRQLTNGLQLVIEPSVRYGLQPITRTDYALKQQYTTAGVIIGLRLQL